MLLMGKKKNRKPAVTGKPTKRYPSREKVLYFGIPLSQAKILKEMGKQEDRSVTWYVKRAVREYLERLGKLAPTSG